MRALKPFLLGLLIAAGLGGAQAAVKQYSPGASGTAGSANTGTSGHTVPFLDGANTWSAAQTFSTPVAVTSGGTGTATQFTQGSVPFAGASGVYTQDNSNLFWDATNLRLGIGTASPVSALGIGSNRSGTPSLPSGFYFGVAAITFTDNATANSGTASGFSVASFNTNTLAASNTSVTTNDAPNVYVRNAIRAGANETIVRSYGLFVDALSSLSNGGAVTTAYGIYAKAPSGATTNNAAGFKGAVTLDGSSSGTITTKTQAAAGTYEWDWPTTAGTAGQVLTSQGGAGTAMTWTSVSLSGTTGSIGGGALSAGACASGTVSVTNSTTAMAVVASPVTYPGDGIFWHGYVSTNGTVTVKVCASVAATPTASAYNVRVIQ